MSEQLIHIILFLFPFSLASSEEIKSEIVLYISLFRRKKINWEMRKVPVDTTGYSGIIHVVLL